MTELKARLRLKRDTSSNWTKNNPVLLNGELIIVDTDSGEVRSKIGDGVKTYTQLPFNDEALKAYVDASKIGIETPQTANADELRTVGYHIYWHGAWTASSVLGKTPGLLEVMSDGTWCVQRVYIFSSVISKPQIYIRNATSATTAFGEWMQLQDADSVAASIDKKVDKPLSSSMSIITAAWKEDSSTADYPYYCEFNIASLTTKDIVNINIAPDYVNIATSCGICPTIESFDGKIRIRAAKIPSKEIKCEYYILQGKV